MLVIKLLFGKHQHFVLDFFISGESAEPCEATLWMTGIEECVRNIWVTSCRRLDMAWQCPMNFSYLLIPTPNERLEFWKLTLPEFDSFVNIFQRRWNVMECIEDDEVVETVFLETVGFLRTKSWTRWNWCLMCLGISMIFPGFSDVFRWFCSGIIRLGSRESREILKMLQAAIDSWRTTLPVTGTLKGEKGENWKKRTTSEKDREELLVTGGHRKDTCPMCPPSNALQVCHICHDPIVIPSWSHRV